MARAAPADRLPELIEAATRVFIEQGYRRTQMADVAHALGVAKGTLYLYVESKQALFAAVMRYADREAPTTDAIALPLATPPAGALARALREGVAAAAAPPALEAAVRRRRPGDVRSELESVVRALYAASSRHRTAIKLIDRCGADHPELAEILYGEGRFRQLDLLARYLESRIGAGRLPPVPDPALAARFVIETIATWAVHLHWDPAPQAIEPAAAERTVVQLVVAALAGN